MERKERKGIRISPGAGAVIMANGIFLLGAVEGLTFIQSNVQIVFAFCLFVLWCIVYAMLSIQFFSRTFIRNFFVNPISSFLVGTWIAGVSVFCHVLNKYFPEWTLVVQTIATINVILAIPFLLLCIRNIILLYRRGQSRFFVHGVLLLSTVGIQSIVLLWNEVFFSWPSWLAEMIIVLGIGFYLFSLLLIARRYLRRNQWSIIKDWENTNCIVHGALSITGFSIVSTQTFSSTVLISLWCMAFMMLIFIESIEIVRGVRRVQVLGLKEGLFTYNTSQWSRNFTFGSFYVFTSFFLSESLYTIPTSLRFFMENVLYLWGWIVFVLLIVQVFIFVYSRGLLPAVKFGFVPARKSIIAQKTYTRK